jgi:MFS family permease
MRSFWLLTGSTSVSMAGNTFLYIAVPWALLESTNSSLLAVLSLAAQAAPYLLGPFLGAFIDRYDRRWTFAIGELVQCGSVALIPVLLAVHAVPAVFVALFVMGLAKVVSDVVADYGIIPTLVPPDRLDKASGWFNSCQLVARFAGPALAGLVIAAVGPGWALEIDAATFLLTFVTAFFMPHQERADTGASITSMLRVGVAYFRSRPDLVRLTCAVALYNLGAGALEPTLLTLGADHWNWSSAAMGVAVSCGAIAAALGAWLSPHVLAGRSRQRRITGWLAVAAAGSLVLLVGTPIVVVAGFCLLCLGEGGGNAASMAYRQAEIPRELAGRVNAIIRTVVIGAVPVSALLLGLVVNLTGSAVIFLPVAATAVASVAVWTVRRDKPVPTATPVPVAAGEERSLR